MASDTVLPALKSGEFLYLKSFRAIDLRRPVEGTKAPSVDWRTTDGADPTGIFGAAVVNRDSNMPYMQVVEPYQTKERVRPCQRLLFFSAYDLQITPKCLFQIDRE